MSGKNETDVTVENSDGGVAAGRDINGIPPEQHERMLREQADLLRKEQKEKIALVERANEAEKGALRKEIELLAAKIGEFERRLANPEDSYREYLDKIRELEKLLEEATDATVAIGANRIADAKAAMEVGDFDAADEIFAEVQQIEEEAVTRAADAAFARGLIAEEQVRWADAAAHYARAARLNPGPEALNKAREFAGRSGDYESALRLGDEMLSVARKSDDGETLATALNNHAIGLNQIGQFAEAETLYRQALEIDKASVGEAHPDYAIRLNNLAGVVQAQGRYPEAETLYRQALEITRAALGEVHPAYATRLNNLAGAVEEQGRYSEAEGLYRQALEIDKASIGDAHPAYAIHLNNLAGVVQVQGRDAEAETLFRQALEIAEESLGPDHPNTQTFRKNLDALLAGRPGD